MYRSGASGVTLMLLLGVFVSDLRNGKPLLNYVRGYV